MYSVKILHNPLFPLTVVILGFLLSFLSIFPINIEKMGSNSLFIFEIIPISYWLGISLIIGTLFFVIPYLNEKHFGLVFVLSSLLLMICFRMVFPLTFTTIPGYEPDVINYMTVTNSWVQIGINFGIEGAYEHNFPLSFIVAFAFVKLGVPVDIFFRVAPFVIYGLNLLFLYLLIENAIPENKMKKAIAAVSVFLFSFSSLGYWITVHYCPALFGSLMFFVSLYLGIRFAKTDKWTLKSILPIFISIFMLILSHHLCTTYLIVTFFSFALSFLFFKPHQFKKGALSFFILGIVTYTLWFSYGTLIYPSFFNLYIYFGGFENVAQLSGNASIFTNITFAIYPAFIVCLFAIEFVRELRIESIRSVLMNLKEKIREIRIRESENTIFVFTISFSLILLLFILGMGVPVLFGTRILEILFIGLYPFASKSLMNLHNSKSLKKRVLIFMILIFVLIISVYRYYNQIQRRVILI